MSGVLRMDPPTANAASPKFSFGDFEDLRGQMRFSRRQQPSFKSTVGIEGKFSCGPAPDLNSPALHLNRSLDPLLLTLNDEAPIAQRSRKLARRRSRQHVQLSGKRLRFLLGQHPGRIGPTGEYVEFNLASRAHRGRLMVLIHQLGQPLISEAAQAEDCQRGVIVRLTRRTRSNYFGRSTRKNHCIRLGKCCSEHSPGLDTGK